MTDTFLESLVQAINTQGFLFQDLVYHEAKRGFEDREHRLRWTFEAREYPVKAADGSETKIDLVLAHKVHRGVHLCVECKRAHPDYKAWVFFGEQPMVRNMNVNSFYVERLVRQSESIWNHELFRERAVSDIGLYTYYLEARLDKKENKPQKSASTESIEKSFTQVLRGQSGLVPKILEKPPADSLVFLPLVVTTANLYRLKYSRDHIKLDDGTLDPKNVEYEPIDWCAAAYHTSTSLAIRSPHVVGTTAQSKLEQDIRGFNSRAVFVVTAESFRKFLFQFGQDVEIFV